MKPPSSGARPRAASSRPGWSLDLALGQMRQLRAPAAGGQRAWSTSLADRAAAKNIAGDWRGARRRDRRAARSIPRSTARSRRSPRCARPPRAGDGVWRVPGGDEIYAAALAEATTTTFTADEIHQLGLQQVAEISAELDTILRTAGLHQRQRRRAADRLNKRPDQLYPNTDAGRAELIAGLNASVADMQGPAAARVRHPADRAARHPPRSARNPGRRVERLLPPGVARRLAPGDLLHQPQEHRRLAQIFAAALTYHEGFPGHHLQLMTAQNAGDMPMLRRIAFYSAYGEGWALYSEQLADELGGYNGHRARRLSPVLPVPRRAAGGRHRPQPQALDPRAGDRSHGRRDRLRPAARRARDRALLRLAGPGLQLQDRPHRLDRAPAPRRRRRSARSSTCAISTTS